MRIANYLAGEGSPEERTETERWISTDPQRRAIVDALRDAWTRAGRAEPRLDVDRAWEQLQRRQAVRDVPDVPPRISRAGKHVLHLMPTRSRWTRRARAAAIVIAALGGGALIARFGMDASKPPAPAPEMRDIATARGQSATVTLGDGSRVVVGFDSRLRFAEGFGGARRDVYLEGEALFEVRHDSLRPFVVHTARATATDLGTTFVVRDYASDSSVTVAVREGIVAFDRTTRDSMAASLSSTTASGVTINPGEFAQLQGTGTITARRGPIDDFFAWTESRLVFRNAPLADVATTLERWYDVDIQLAAGASRRTVNATFGDEGIETTLKLIAKATDVRVMRRGRTFTLVPLHASR